MLLRNESKLLFTLDIHLIYDDNTEIHEEVSIGDILKITYRHNSDMIVNTGKLVKIIPVFKTRPHYEDQICHCHYNANPSSILVMDFSTNMNSSEEKIPVEELLKIEVLPPPEPEPLNN